MKFSCLKEKNSFIFKILILIVCGLGLYLNFKIGPFNKMILYFTVQSNLLCFIFYLVVLLLKIKGKLKKSNTYYIFKGMVTMSITITMVVYWLLISSSNGLWIYKDHMLECRFVHLYTPILIILDYIIFGEKGKLKKSYPFIWSLVLILYTFFCVVYSYFGGTFINGASCPYLYMDINEFGIARVILNCGTIYIIYIIYGFIVQAVDNILRKG